VDEIIKTIRLIDKQMKKFNVPWVSKISARSDPYKVLISCLLSLRTKDKTTEEASRRLFKVADSPKKMVILSLRHLRKLIRSAAHKSRPKERRIYGCRSVSTLSKPRALAWGKLHGLIYPVGFYRNKAKTILEVSKSILEDYKGRVPAVLEDLFSFKGVGRKTANLVLGLGYGVPSICVDTHVHRISNRLGWIKTKSPEQTEDALGAVIPKRYWISLNTILVAFGQNICLPISPYCSRYSVLNLCERRGVEKWR
jgi:endonuclease-3